MNQSSHLVDIKPFVFDQSMQHTLAGDAEHVSEDRAQFDIGVFQTFLNSITLGSSVRQELLSVSCQITLLPDVA